MYKTATDGTKIPSRAQVLRREETTKEKPHKSLAVCSNSKVVPSNLSSQLKNYCKTNIDN